ncbi:MAG: ABC transporter ATP-binding protein [Campylobacteraceae bacterium]|nr:ABC transporter ATP-binding protein [Campylobacteraceae bacterium]
MAYLSLKNLSKSFGNFNAVDDFNLDIEQGEFVSLLGPSGCGKTTTLQMIGGFLEPTRGQIVLDGKDITKEKANKRNFGIVFQTYALFSHMTVFQNVSFGLETRKVPKSKIKEEVAEILELVKLSHLQDRYPAELSGGQRQRVAIARALIYKPSLLLLDEPLSNLDAKLRENMQLELRDIQQTTGTTTLLVTHDQQEAMSLSDRVVVMNEGSIKQIGEPRELYDNPNSYFSLDFLGKSNKLYGEIFQKNENEYSIKIEDYELPININSSNKNFEFYLRPEKIKINNLDSPGIKAVVKSKLFLGIYIIYVCKRGDNSTLLIYTQEKFINVNVGDKVSLSWETSNMIFFKDS